MTSRDTALLVGMCWALLISALALPVMPSRSVSLCPSGATNENRDAAVLVPNRLLDRCPDFRYARQLAAHEGHDFDGRAGFAWPLEKPVTECATGAGVWVLWNWIHHT